MSGGRYMIREYKSGDVVERSLFPVSNSVKPRRRRKKGSTPARKQDQNDRDAAKRLARTINCNFEPGDMWITLTCDEERMERLIEKLEQNGLAANEDNIRTAAIHERNLFIRRLKRTLEKQGVALRFIAATSDMDGETGEAVRVHHHLILPKEAFEAAITHWSREELSYKPLRNQKDYTPIAVYIIRQVRRQPDIKKYSTSRNLKKPVIKERIVLVKKELRAPAGAVVMHRSEYDIESSTQYIRYIAPTKKEKRGGKKELPPW